jgi:hypothetical protein
MDPSKITHPDMGAAYRGDASPVTRARSRTRRWGLNVVKCKSVDHPLRSAVKAGGAESLFGGAARKGFGG